MDFTQKEIEQAQQALNLYPDASPFWDSARGQETLEVAAAHHLTAQNTNRERCAIHGKLMEAARREIYGE